MIHHSVLSRGIADGRGSALILAIGYLAVVTILASTFLTMLNRSVTYATQTEHEQACLNIAEGGLDKALAVLRVQPRSYRGEANTPLGEGRFSVTVEPGAGAGAYRVTSTAEVVGGGHVLAQARVAAEIELTGSGAVRTLRWSEVKRW